MRKLDTKFQKLADIEVAYTECGEGPVLILLHGNSGSKRVFREYQTRHFAAYHTYALDSRGHGQSVSTDEGYSIERYSEDVIAFCKARGIAKARVIGYSDGGNIALDIARSVPGASLRKIDGCTHLSILRKPAAIEFMKDYLGA